MSVVLDRSVNSVRTHILLVFLCLLHAHLNPVRAEGASLPLLPHVTGFGVHSFGGSGRHLTPATTQIFFVRTLADEGHGSLRECAENNIPRTCLFEVAGEIRLKKMIRIRDPYITIAGQSAPSSGVSIVQAGIAIQTHDVLIQHIAIRPGDSPVGSKPSERDAISIGTEDGPGAYNVVLDHLSLTSAVDENISTAYSRTQDLTITNCLIAEGLHRSIHPKGPHSKGVLIGDGTQRVTISKNLLAMNEERNPYLKPGTSVEFINNVVYGWGDNARSSMCNLTNNTTQTNPVSLTFIGNVYRGSATSYLAAPVYAKRLASESKIFVHDTIGPTNTEPYRNDWEATNLPDQSYQVLVPPILSSAHPPLLSTSVWETILKNAGSHPARRLPHDARIIEEVASLAGGLKDCSTGCAHSTGREAVATEFHTLTLPPTPFHDTDRDGYTDLENWLHILSNTAERVGN